MFTLPILPYDQAALEPYMSAQTLSFHYGKHHQTYIDNLNKLIAGTDLEKESLENIIIKTAGQAEKIAIFNNAAQHYNHSFFWQCLRPVAQKMEPSEKLAAALTASFGSLDNFYAEFKTAALGQFGSGWVWLVKDGESLKIMKTANADTPIAHNLKPLFVLDVWEHAYYLDYQNRRADFAEAVLKNLVNWELIEKNL
jgi:Fe-Mn family superoxide dismutase